MSWTRLVKRNHSHLSYLHICPLPSINAPEICVGFTTFWSLSPAGHRWSMRLIVEEICKLHCINTNDLTRRLVKRTWNCHDMTDAGSSSTNPELEYLLEFHRRFSSWGISPPRFSEKEQTSIDRFKVASHSAASAPPPPRNTTSVITSALTKCLDFVASFLKITNFFSATKQLKGG